MSADIIKLPGRRGGAVPKAAGRPLALVARQVVVLLRLAECDLVSPTPTPISVAAAMVKVQVAATDLEKAIAAHSTEQAYSIGQMFALALGLDNITKDTLAGAKRTLELLAEALP